MRSNKYPMTLWVEGGFTLIELMVVIAIISILLSVALPSYNDYIVRSKIPDATSELSAKRARVEAFYDNNHTYVGAPDCVASSGKFFNFTCPSGNLTLSTYTLQAEGTGTMAGFTYTIDQANAKATTSVPSGWTSNANCWVLRKDGSC